MSSPRYAAITLGSNSFNMLVAHTVNGQSEVVAKYKRKVRLAEGIEPNGLLNELVFRRGVECLEMFAQMLKKERVNPDNVAVIATATLRSISNAEQFCQVALSILPQPIEIISGLQEAELIYQGMVATTAGKGCRLVLDIGGASTELIIGDEQHILYKTSLPIGCVTYNEQFFAQPTLDESHFVTVRQAVNRALSSSITAMSEFNWQSVVGVSGTIQSIMELLAAREQPQLITLEVLHNLKQEVLSQDDNSLSGITGLSAERAPTFVAGLAIILALFELLSMTSLQLSGGALREGVLKILADKL